MVIFKDTNSMTLQQAIIILKHLKETFGSVDSKETIECFDLAIAALHLTTLGKKEKESDEWPKEGDLVYWLDSVGGIYYIPYINAAKRKWNENKNFTGIFRTKERAILKRDVIKALANANPWVPMIGYDYLYFSFLENNECPMSKVWHETNINKAHLSRGNCFPITPEGRKRCEEYGRFMLAEAEEVIKENT